MTIPAPARNHGDTVMPRPPLRLVSAPASARVDQGRIGSTHEALGDVAAWTSPCAATGEALPATDEAALLSLQAVLRTARQRGDARPTFAVIAGALEAFGIALPEPHARVPSLEKARSDWLRRLESAGRSRSTVSAYRIAIDDLLSFLDRSDGLGGVFAEETIVAYLDDYRRRAAPAPATYYRRFTLLRRFFCWLSHRGGLPDPFLDVDAPPKPQQEADWLTRQEFEQLLDAAGSPPRKRPGLAERDQLVLRTLVTTGLRRSELLALDWRDLDLESPQPSLLVRRGKGGKPRRQPLPCELARDSALEGTPFPQARTGPSSAASRGSG